MRLGRWMSMAVVAVAFGAVPSAFAQDSAAVEEMIGQGIHLYFDRNLRLAHEVFTAAIEEGSKDPRAYYFRGLCNAGLGRAPDARQDFDKGSQLEAGGGDMLYDVSRSLERVQGRARLALEQYRHQARLAATAAREQDRQRRYEVLRQSQPGGAPSAPANAGGPPMPPAEAAPSATTPPADPANPFGSTPATTPAGTNPFDTPATPPASTPPAGSNPFDTPATPPPATPPAGSNPFDTPAQPGNAPQGSTT